MILDASVSDYEAVVDHGGINHPPHYCEGRSIETIDVIENWGLDYHLGNVVKYISRAGRKGPPLEDLQKARWYLNRAIERMKGEGQ